MSDAPEFTVAELEFFAKAGPVEHFENASLFTVERFKEMAVFALRLLREREKDVAALRVFVEHDERRRGCVTPEVVRLQKKEYRRRGRQGDDPTWWNTGDRFDVSEARARIAAYEEQSSA